MKKKTKRNIFLVYIGLMGGITLTILILFFTNHLK
jgi:hypothetical protein